ncbi:MAG TPA: DUF2225 domain-containing protein [Methylomusa anaerophila]|uniref:Tetratricopeptide repeat protein n=1 Tax=Methylomusa anaerophila TaxID=1930071 RepID=A0A348AH04_9FIRM|nr:DUF2225 domain-containing protein [Methylomusa anaerophila]BBB90352.1 hypothetical protein MAMMFC1_01000 [Methylomusa anaerophila]HML89302.1 DUF2225 domain-containing protein [Methylomusa anaerophila]
MVAPTYEAEKNCPVCEKNFRVTKVRSRQVMVSQDADFCAHFKDINPYYYTVWVCPHCGYAAGEARFGEMMSAAAKDQIQKFLAARQVNVNFCGERTREQAINAYKLAIFYAELIASPYSWQADLYLKLGWIYRESEQAAEEMAALTKACELYELALARERLPIGGTLSEMAVTYLIGELAHRTGQYGKASAYLNKVVGNPAVKQEPRIAALAREAWQQMRADREKVNTMAK